MVQIPDDLQAMFSAELEQDAGDFALEVPGSEVELGAVEPGAVYRVAVIGTTEVQSEQDSGTDRASQSQAASEKGFQDPPVDKGEVRSVTIESVGDQGDGIAKVDRGYVVIVPGAEPGDTPTVEIEKVKKNVSFAKVID